MTGPPRSPDSGAHLPRVTVDLDAIRENTARLVERFDGEIYGVTKGVGGDVRVAEAMLAGGAAGLADSRMATIRRLDANFDTHLQLLRVPMQSELPEVVRFADSSLQSELDVVRRLSRLAETLETEHDVLLVVDMGDRREGVLPGDVREAAAEIAALPRVRLAGLATNLGCFGGVVPTAETMGTFVQHAEAAEAAVGHPLETVSGGSSSCLPLLEAGTLPDRVTHLRIGEAILLGRETAHYEDRPYLRQDAFTLEAEVIERKRKPGAPSGETGTDAFGETPSVGRAGEHERGVLALGKQDTSVSGLEPVDPAVSVVGATSDHTVVDLEDVTDPPAPGDTVAFRLDYRALLGAFTGPDVHRVYH